MALADFKSVMPRDERGRWVRLPRTPANIIRHELESHPRSDDSELRVSTVVTNSEALVTEFLTDRLSKGLSPRTYEFYRGYLKRFMLGVVKPLLELTKQDIAHFINSLPCKPGGKHAYFRAIRAFYRWAETEDLISSVPRMVAPKVPRPLRPTVGLDDVGKLLDAAQSVRDKLAVSMLADTGLRRAELCSVAWGDIDRERDTIRVWGKGARQRLVRFGPQTKELLDLWTNESCHSNDDALLGIKPTGLQDILKRLEKKTGIKCNAHAFRRTFACESVRNGINVFYIQSLLGHSSLAMTRIYAEQVTSEDAIEAYKPVVKRGDSALRTALCDD